MDQLFNIFRQEPVKALDGPDGAKDPKNRRYTCGEVQVRGLLQDGELNQLLDIQVQSHSPPSISTLYTVRTISSAVVTPARSFSTADSCRVVMPERRAISHRSASAAFVSTALRISLLKRSTSAIA